MLKTKALVPEAPAKTIVEIVQELLSEHIDICRAIVTDYVGGPGMEDELEIAYMRLQDKINDLDDDPPFDSIMKSLRDVEELTDANYEDLLFFIEENSVDAKKILNILNDYEIEAHFVAQNYAVIKISGMDQAIKLEDFVNTQLYPNYNDQDKYSLPLI